MDTPPDDVKTIAADIAQQLDETNPKAIGQIERIVEHLGAEAARAMPGTTIALLRRQDFANSSWNATINRVLPTIHVGARQGSHDGKHIIHDDVLFSILTLPVEINASTRALRMLREAGLTESQNDTRGARQMLTAAALTYLAAAISSILQLLYYISVAQRRR